MTAEKEKILDKLQKLINKQESAEKIGNLQEAEAFAMKVSELLTKHNLSKFDITKKEVDHITNKYFPEIVNPKNEGRWIYQLYGMLCRHNYCRLITHSGYGATIFGDEDSVQVILFLAKQLENKLRYSVRGAWAKAKSNPREKKNRFYRAYFEYAVYGIDTKLRLQKEEEAKSSTITAMVLCNKEALDKAIESKFGEDLKPGRKGGIKKQSMGAAMGYEDGKKISINHGLEEAKYKEKII